jgi:extracellular matrix protein 14
MILDIWDMTSGHVDIRLPRTSTRGFLSMLPTHLSSHEPLISNLRAAVDYTYPLERTILPSLEVLQALADTEETRRKGDDVHYLSDIFFANYQPYNTVNQWLYLLESLRPELVEIIHLGNSYEGREILGLKVHGSGSKRRVDDGKSQNSFSSSFDGAAAFATQGIVMHAAQHAREWISVSTLCYIAYEMISGYYIHESTRKLVDEFEWRYLYPSPPSPPFTRTPGCWC